MAAAYAGRLTYQYMQKQYVVANHLQYINRYLFAVLVKYFSVKIAWYYASKAHGSA